MWQELMSHLTITEKKASVIGLEEENSLILDGANQFAVTYRVDDGGGGFNTVSSGNVFNIPNDDTWRNYRFIYLPVTGTGYLFSRRLLCNGQMTVRITEICIGPVLEIYK